jgi:hypothetical protein
MKATHLFAGIAALSLVSFAARAEAGCQCKAETFPTVLEAIVVTEKGSYTLAEWERKQEARQQLAATPAVYLQPVVVTPDYEISAEERRQYAQAKARAMPAAYVSSAPASPLRPSLISFLRRLFN